MIQIKKLCNTRNYLIVMFGVAVSLFLGGVISCGTLDLRQFFPVGTVCDFNAQNLKESSETFIYRDEEEAFLLTSDLASKLFTRVESSTDLHYLVFEVSHLKQEPVDAIIYYRDVLGTYRGSQGVSLCNGQNWVYVTVPEFRFFILEIKGQEGGTIAFDSIHARERAPVSKRKIALSVAVLFLIYLLAAMCVCRARRKRCGMGWLLGLLEDVLCCLYGMAYRLFQNYMPKNLTEKRRRQIRTLLFAVLFFLLWLSNVLRWYMDAGEYKYYLLVLCIIFVAIAAVSVDKSPLEDTLCGDLDLPSEEYLLYKKDRKTNVWKPERTWMLLCLSMCFSDYFVSKFYKFIGWVFLLVFGIFFDSWHKMKHPRQLLEDMAKSLRILFWPGLLFCIFCRRKMGALLYNGLYRDSDSFAVYAVFMLVIFLAGLARCFAQGYSARQKRYYGMGALICWYYLLSSASEVCLLLGGVITLLILWRNRSAITISRQLIAFFCVGLFLVCGIHICARNIPQNTRLQVKFQNETRKTWKSKETIEAMRVIDERNYKKVICKQDMNDGHTWLAYLRSANLFGHEARALKLWGRTSYPSNCFVMILYRYGMITLIFYILFSYRAGTHAFCLVRRARQGLTEAEIIVCGSILVFLIAGQFVEIEMPFLTPVWLAFYLVAPVNIDVKK